MSMSPLLATLLCGAAATFLCAGTCRADEAAVPEVRVADLLKLPVDDDYKADPYLKAAQSLQAMGKEKACVLLRKLAAQDKWPSQRTVTLCRMLFKAKRGDKFDRAEVGGPSFLPGGTDVDDWPLEPITIVDGVPFLVARGYGVGGLATPVTFYVVYCTAFCEWNDFKFKPKSREEMKKALDSLLMSPKLKGKLKDGDKDFFESQIK